MSKPKIVIFECGCSEGGGLRTEKFAEAIKKEILHAEIVGVVSNYEEGGVCIKARKHNIPFFHFPKPWNAENYQRIASESGADFFVLAGWHIPVIGLDHATKFNSKRVIGIHPGPIPTSGEPNHTNEAIIASFNKGIITETEINIYFLSKKTSDVLVIAKVKIPINKKENSVTLRTRVLGYEYIYHPRIINLVVNEMISWDGINHDSLEIPTHYSIEQ
ncbi:MAG TPA: hypothetical protein VIK86_08380 [Candidatus Paceibacterota bacterium]